MPDVELFDAAVYGVSASEALVLDPQQRLMLEVSFFAGQGMLHKPVRQPTTTSAYCTFPDS